MYNTTMKQVILSKDREILSIMTELSKAVRCCRQDEVFCEDVTFTQFIILDTVARNRTLNMASLHDALSVDKSTTTRLVAPLIKRNLIVREKADHDSRAATLKLTEEGSEVHGKVWQCLISFIRAVQNEIPHEKRAERPRRGPSVPERNAECIRRTVRNEMPGPAGANAQQ